MLAVSGYTGSTVFIVSISSIVAILSGWVICKSLLNLSQTPLIILISPTGKIFNKYSLRARKKTSVRMPELSETFILYGRRL